MKEQYVNMRSVVLLGRVVLTTHSEANCRTHLESPGMSRAVVGTTEQDL